MEGFVKTLLSLSFSGTFLFLIVLLIVRLCRNRMSRRWQYYIWLLVVLRFLVPITVPNALTGNLFRDVERAVEERALATETVGDKNAANVTADASDNLSEKWERQNTAAYRMTADRVEQNALADRRAPGIYFWLFGIWFAGAFGLLIRKIAAYQKYMHFLRNGNTEVSDLTVLNLLADVEEELKIRRTIELYRNPMISSPIMTGFLKPGIVIPDRKITEKELICVFTHELVHFKYLDMFYKWLVQVTICIHWFNPFIRLLGKEVNKCCELACDEKVIGALDEQARKAYGDTLLAFLQRGGTYRNPLPSITLTEGAEQIIERLGAIMDYQKKSGTVILLTTALTVLVGFFFSGIGAYAEEKAGGQETAGQKADDWKAGYYAYYQRSQYEEPYLIEYGWNLKEEYMTYYAREEIQLEDQSSVTVCFAEEAERWMKDAEAMEAVARLLGELKPIARRQYGFEFERPYIVRMIYLPPDEIGDFARRAFENDNIADFSAVVRLLSEDEKKEYCEKSYERDAAGFFSIIISEMGEDYVTEFAERCYEKDDITYFSIMEYSLSDEARKNLMERALQENREAYYYILEPEEYEKEWQERLKELEDMADELRELKDMEGENE